MKFTKIKKFEQYLSNNSEIIDGLEDILVDLKDDYFNISIIGRLNNKSIVVRFIKDNNGKAIEFDLLDIKGYVNSMLTYLKSNGYVIDTHGTNTAISAFDLSKPVYISSNINEWVSVNVLGLNFYFVNEE